MPSSLYVALAGQVSMNRRLETIANNLANMTTPGYRAEEVKFETLLSKTRAQSVAFPTSGETYISRRPGPMTYTGNPLDVAAEGNHWFALQTPDGTVYTRDGRLKMNEVGELQSVAGYPVLDPGGAPIRVDPQAGPIVIGDDGSIMQDDRQVGGLGVFQLPDNAKLSRYENSGVMSDQPGVLPQDPVGAGVRQGYIEGANVNPIMEMTRLIAVTRAFEMASSAMGQGESTQDEAIRSLGSPT